MTDWCDWLLKDTGLTFEQFKKLGILKGEMRYRKYETRGLRHAVRQGGTPLLDSGVDGF